MNIQEEKNDLKKKFFPNLNIDHQFKAEFGTVYRFTQSNKEYDLYIEGDFPIQPPRLFQLNSQNPGQDLLTSTLKSEWSESLSLDSLRQTPISEQGLYTLGCTFPLYLFSKSPSFQVKALNPSSLKPWQDLKIILTNSHLFQVAEYKNSGYLVAHGSLKSIKSIKTIPACKGFCIVWRGHIDYIQVFSGHSAEVVEKIVACLSGSGVKFSKSKSVQKTIKEEDVGPGSIKRIKINEIEADIIETELDLEAGLTKDKVNLVIELYQKAIEYYSALGIDKFDKYLGKIRELMGNSEVLRVLSEEKQVIVRTNSNIVSELESQEVWPENLEVNE